MSETRQALQEMEVGPAMLSVATSTYWEYRHQEAENARRMAVQREARLALKRSALPPVGAIFRNPRMVEKWTEQVPLPG